MESSQESGSVFDPTRGRYVYKGIATGRIPEAYVRFQLRKNSKGAMRIEMSLGRAVWYAIGRPERVSLEWHGEQLRIVPDMEDGWKLHVRVNASPRCWLPGDIEIAPGRYAATVKNNMIIVGALDERTQAAR